jgi:isoleucyl-tRNA synthetase
MSPIAPFYADKLYSDLSQSTGLDSAESVHLASFPKYDEAYINKSLEERMEYARHISSMVLGLRRKAEIKVRRPLSKIMLPIVNADFAEKIDSVKDIILSETNVKEIEYLTDTSGVLVKEVKPEFSILGKKYKKLMKHIAKAVAQMSQEDINIYENEGQFTVNADGEEIVLKEGELNVSTKDIPGLLATAKNGITVALDTTITEALELEGTAREIVNKVQNLRKEMGLNLTDRIKVNIENNPTSEKCIKQFGEYISSQVLADEINLTDSLSADNSGTVFVEFESTSDSGTNVNIEKV